jgi:hypothetical protein
VASPIPAVAPVMIAVFGMVERYNLNSERNKTK